MRGALGSRPPLGPFRRLCETQGARRRCVDALVAVVPFDAIASRRWAVDDFLYDAPARWPLGRFGLDLHVIACFQLHALTSCDWPDTRVIPETTQSGLRRGRRVQSSTLKPDPLRW